MVILPVGNVTILAQNKQTVLHRRHGLRPNVTAATLAPHPSVYGATAPWEAIMLTEKLMRAMWPNGNADTPGLVEAIAAQAATVFANHGLDSELVVAHAMAQFNVECGNGTEMTENINYTPERAAVVWH